MKLPEKIKEFASSGTAEFAIIGTGSDEVREAYYELRKMVINEGAEKHTGLTFGAALTALKEGYRVAREEWVSANSIAVLEIVNVDFHAPYFRIGHFVRGEEPIYVVGDPCIDDMLADDWQLAPPPYEKDKECQGNCGACECGHRSETEAEESLRP